MKKIFTPFNICLFGSIYLCSTSLNLINQLYLQNKKPPNNLIILNGSIFIISSFIILNNFF